MLWNLGNGCLAEAQQGAWLLGAAASWQACTGRVRAEPECRPEAAATCAHGGQSGGGGNRRAVQGGAGRRLAARHVGGWAGALERGGARAAAAAGPKGSQRRPARTSSLLRWPAFLAAAQPKAALR